jgi:hypothetical protein
MSFSDLNAAYSELRDALRTHVAVTSIDDLNIRPPAGEADEAFFLRLVAWCFSLLFETGRHSIPFLLDLKFDEKSEERQLHQSTRMLVQQLRSFVSHNLGFAEDHDVEVRKAVSDWFVKICGAAFPVSHDDWAKCFRSLCVDARNCVRYCTATLSRVISSPDDRDLIVRDLRHRIDRYWKTHQFDQIIEDAAARLGERINPRALRDRHLSSWQRYLATLPDDADPKSEFERLIDGQVADHFRSRLPIGTREIMEALELEPGPEVKRAIDVIRELFESGIWDKKQLLEKAGLALEKK